MTQTIIPNTLEDDALLQAYGETLEQFHQARKL